MGWLDEWVHVGSYLLFTNGDTWRNPITIEVHRSERLGDSPVRTMNELGVWFYHWQGNVEMYPWHVINGMEWVPE